MPYTQNYVHKLQKIQIAAREYLDSFTYEELDSQMQWDDYLQTLYHRVVEMEDVGDE